MNFRKEPKSRNVWRVINEGYFYPEYSIEKADKPDNIPDKIWKDCIHDDIYDITNVTGIELFRFKSFIDTTTILLLKSISKKNKGECFLIGYEGCKKIRGKQELYDS